MRFVFGNDCAATTCRSRATGSSAASASARSRSRTWRIAVVAMMLAVFAFLAFTRIGKAMRAVADNPALAAQGHQSRRVARMANFVGMGLAGVGGMLIGLDTLDRSADRLPRILLSIFAAAVVGGLGSIPGAVVGALLIGVAEELSLLVLAPAYRTAVGFVAILLVLTLRPRGSWASGRIDACERSAHENYLILDAPWPPIAWRHLRAAGARPEPDLGHGRHGQSRPRRLLRRRRLCLGAADHGGPRADRCGLAAGAGRRRRGRAGRHALDHAAARRLSRHRHARLRRSRAARRRQRDLAHQRHRRHLRHSRARGRGARPRTSTPSIS